MDHLSDQILPSISHPLAQVYYIRLTRDKPFHICLKIIYICYTVQIFIFQAEELILWIELPWPEKSAEHLRTIYGKTEQLFRPY